MRFGFVVLHYKTLRDTTECVASLLRLAGDKRVIIVENFSNNGTLEQLLALYAGRQDVTVIASGRNVGFARGNNLGIAEAIRQRCDFVVLLNNDTLIRQEDFILRCIRSWEKNRFAIGGPRILSLADGADGKDQNPFIVPRHFVKTRKDAFMLWLLGLLKYLTVLFGLPAWWERGAEKTSLTGGAEETALTSDTRDFLLCGAALILSPTYLERYSKLCDFTFLYEEETILYILARLLNDKVMYDPDMLVYHKEQSATGAAVGTGRKKLLFGYREDYRSRGQVLRLMLHMNNKAYLADLLK